MTEKGTMKNKFIYVLLLLVCFFMTACQSGEKKTTPQKVLRKTDNVVLLLIDTLRADHLPFYGYHKDTAPFLSSLAEKSVIFERAFSTSSTTAPSTASIFTSLYPSQHGVITGYIATKRLAKKYQDKGIVLNAIPADFVTLGEVFKQAGYKTYSLADNMNISREMGYDQGFDKFETFNYAGAEKINSVLKSWKSDLDNNGKYFLYLHYMDPHLPYHQRKPWYEETSDRLQKKINAYDSEISYLDKHIAEMFDLYSWLENATVIVVADHGEEFFEHGNYTHGKSLYREVLHVPLMIYHPDITPHRVAQTVSLIDVLPTLADLCGFKQEKEWMGYTLVPAIFKDPLRERAIFSELLRRPEMQETHTTFRSVISDDLHFIESVYQGVKKEELFNLKTDFNEKKNIVTEDREVTARLRGKLKALEDKKYEALHKEVNVNLDEEMLNRLKTLGYVN